MRDFKINVETLQCNVSTPKFIYLKETKKPNKCFSFLTQTGDDEKKCSQSQRSSILQDEDEFLFQVSSLLSLVIIIPKQSDMTESKEEEFCCIVSKECKDDR